jgi:hypothetical protein
VASGGAAYQRFDLFNIREIIQSVLVVFQDSLQKLRIAEKIFNGHGLNQG